MTQHELDKVPKYVRRMSAFTEKISQLYEEDPLFGQAIQTVGEQFDEMWQVPIRACAQI